jgi:cytochrome P450
MMSVTTAIGDAQLPVIEVFSSAFERDPYPVYEAARRQHWIARCELGYFVLAHDAVADLLKDSRLATAGAQVATMLGATEGPWGRWISTMLLNTDGERHARLRRLVNPAFTPRRADASRDMMRAVFTGLLEPHLRGGRLDLMTDVCDHYPVRVLCNMIGVEEVDVPRFAAWVDTLGKGYDLNPALVPELDAAMVGMWDYVSQMVSRRAAGGGHNDLVQALISASEEGDRLSHDELITMIILLLGAGADTTKHQLANVVHALITRDKWAGLREDRDLIPAAVEEGLRFQPTASAFPRAVVDDLDYRGLKIPAGSFLLMSASAAGRDAESFAAPDEFDTQRTGGTHLAFGLGAHFCLGANIARAEMQIGLDVLLNYLEEPGLDGPVTWSSPIGVWGPKTLPLSFSPIGSMQATEVGR